jgi:hypothetical protein
LITGKAYLNSRLLKTQTYPVYLVLAFEVSTARKSKINWNVDKSSFPRIKVICE